MLIYLFLLLFRRTFLSWLNFTVVLAGLSIGLLNFGDKVGKISAGMFTLVSMAVMIYALITYHWRANAIRKRGSGPYDDRLGPTCLCISLLGEHRPLIIIHTMPGVNLADIYPPFHDI